MSWADSAFKPALEMRIWIGLPGIKRGMSQSMVTARTNVRT